MLTLKELREPFVVENQGEKIFGVLHRPEGVENYPIVVIFHGYASTKVGTLRSHVKLAMRLVDVGIACCRFDFRGAGDSTGDMSKMTLEDLCSDGEAVLNYLGDQGFENIGLFGSSLGGSIAIMVASRRSIDALALWAPVASGSLWFQDWQNRQKEQTTSLETYQGVQISEDFRNEFGNFRADLLLETLNHIPLLHMQGDQDQIVSLRHAEAFKKAKSKMHDDTKFIQYHDVEHQLGRSKVFDAAVLEICDFFKTYLG